VADKACEPKGKRAQAKGQKLRANFHTVRAKAQPKLSGPKLQTEIGTDAAIDS